MTATNNTALRYRLLRLSLLVGALVLGGCASAPPRRHVAPPPNPAPPPRPSTEVYFYPAKGQGPEQQDRDRYDCYLWSVKQTGFDPSAPGLTRTQQVRVVPATPPGHDAATGAAAGAVIGAVVAPPHRFPEGVIAGAVTGAVIGAASDSAREERAERTEERLNNQREAARAASLEQQASNYRRAMAACLEGRGYTVR